MRQRLGKKREKRKEKEGKKEEKTGAYALSRYIYGPPEQSRETSLRRSIEAFRCKLPLYQRA